MTDVKLYSVSFVSDERNKRYIKMRLVRIKKKKQYRSILKFNAISYCLSSSDPSIRTPANSL